MKISITGKFGTGKSVFSKYLSNNKVPIINGDLIGKQLLNEKRVEIFDYLNLEYNEDNYIKVLKIFILEKEDNFVKYNKWMYEHLPRRILNECSKYKDVILDAALVFEWAIDDYFDLNILIIDGSFEERFERIKKSRKSVNKNLYKLLEKNQLNDNKKIKKANIVIYNNRELDFLKERANEIYKKYFTH